MNKVIIIWRDELKVRDLFKRYKMGTTIWSPLESGILTVKYINGIPNDSRYKIDHDNSKVNIQAYYW